MENKKKKINPFLIFFCILMGVTILLCASVAGLWLHGRNALTHTEQAPSLPAENPTISSPANNVVVYNSKRYQYNEDMCNILLLGIDSDDTPGSAEGNHDQADILVLAALDLAGNRMSLISVPRDILCDFETLDKNGNSSGVLNAHLALAYAYGDGQHQSCQITANAVSNIFYGLPIHGYGAYYMKGIGSLNDAVGGVPITVLDDIIMNEVPGASRLVPGAQVTLNAREAEIYLRVRLEYQADANQHRMQRQKQYMLSLLSQAKERVKENPASLLTMYDAVDEYILTNLDIGQISYLATEAVSMDFTGDIRSLTGELSLDAQNRAVLTLDQEALYDLMLDVFYTEIP